jgi:ubiquinone/menaquinone biosynthesis C-methylase UbiE
MQRFDRWLFRDSRAWACSRARGTTLEVAVGTGLNLAHYPADVTLTGIDLSEKMLDIARDRAAELGLTPSLQKANAHELPFGDATFDTVVCTFGLCAIPDLELAVDEMMRVLRPGGSLILVDHVESSSVIVRGVQRLLEVVTVPLGNERFRRRPFKSVVARGLEVEQRDRFALGLVERLVARKAQAR